MAKKLKISSIGNKIFQNPAKWQQSFLKFRMATRFLKNLVKWQRDFKNLVKWHQIMYARNK